MPFNEAFNFDLKNTNIPHHRFYLFGQLQYYIKVIVFLLPKFQKELEQDQIISRIIHQMLNNENTVRLEIRLTCLLVWHLSKENNRLLLNAKLEQMKKVTDVVILYRLALYFGLIKTTMTNELCDTNLFVQLIHEIFAFKTRDATIMVGIFPSSKSFNDNIDEFSVYSRERF